jgi:hypothetical protein
VIIFLVRGIEFRASGRPVIVALRPGTGLALQGDGSREGGLNGLLLLLLRETVEGVGGLSSWWRGGWLGGLAQGLEIGVLRLGIGCSGWEAVRADDLLGFRSRRRHNGFGDSNSRNGRSRQNLALRRSAVLGGDVDRALII